MRDVEYLIIGAGPTGLAAACRLQELGKEWCLLEAEGYFGGLASSFVDENGFTWDLGGHVQFSHYDTFDRYMDMALGEDGWFHHQRESWVWIKERFVPYPFQNNLHRLDPEDRWACIKGLFQAAAKRCSTPNNFAEWMSATFGAGISDLFMRPYNFKVWAYPAETMDFHWIGERVSVPDIETAVKSICTNEDDVSWGPNSTFRFPKQGGTGAVWQSIGAQLPPQCISLNSAVELIDAKRKVVTTSHGDKFRYRYLISTMPLDVLIRQTNVVDPAIADKLVYSSTNVIGIGIDGQPPEHLRSKCWMYFPEHTSPYYRITVFSNYSPNNCAKPAQQWSLMTETSESSHKPVHHDRLIEQTLNALRADQLLADNDEIVSLTSRRIHRGYPTPFLGRDAMVDPLLRTLEGYDLYSRGRFGSWKYEVANQDHSFAQGYECVNRLVNQGGSDYEPTIHRPGFVNSRRNP